MKNKHLIIGIASALVAIAVAGLLWWQFGGGVRTPGAEDVGKITMAWNAWPGTLPFLVAQDKGFFAKEGLNVSLEFRENYGDLLSDAISGTSDVTTVALMDAILANVDGANLQVVGVQDYSNGADGIVAKKSIEAMRDVKDKKIAVEVGTLGEYLLSAALDTAGLREKDVTIVSMSAQDAAKAFIRGEVDAAVTYEPDYTDAVEQGDGWRIFTSADEPGIIIDAVVAKKEYLNAHPEKISALLKAQFKAVQFITDNPSEAYAIGAKYFKIRPAEFATQIQGVKLQSKRDNVTAFSYAAGYESLFGNIRYVNNFLKRIGKIQTDIDTDIIVPDFVRALNR